MRTSVLVFLHFRKILSEMGCVQVTPSSRNGHILLANGHEGFTVLGGLNSKSLEISHDERKPADPFTW